VSDCCRCIRSMEVRRKWGEVMRDYYARVKRGDPQLAARTPDDQIRLVSYVFANTKQLDKVRLSRRDSVHASWEVMLRMLIMLRPEVETAHRYASTLVVLCCDKDRAGKLTGHLLADQCSAILRQSRVCR